jgi:hypothetical protein
MIDLTNENSVSEEVIRVVVGCAVARTYACNGTWKV